MLPFACPNGGLGQLWHLAAQSRFAVSCCCLHALIACHSFGSSSLLLPFACPQWWPRSVVASCRTAEICGILLLSFFSSLAIVLAPAASSCSSHALMVASVCTNISPHTPSFAVCCSRLVDVALCMHSSRIHALFTCYSNGSSLLLLFASPQWWPRSVAASRRTAELFGILLI